MKLSDETKATQFIVDAMPVVVKLLVAKYKLTDDEASQDARDLLHEICAECGGQQIYIGRDMEFELTARDLKIYNEHTGYNTHSIAKRHGISDTRVRQICKAIKDQRVAKAQMRLPGLDD